MKFRGLLFACAIITLPAAASAENITITTYFPAPYGAYSDLNVHNQLAIKDINGTAAEVTVTSDSSGDLRVDSTQNFYQFKFKSPNMSEPKPFSYWIPFNQTSGSVYCEPGYVAVGYLTASKIPANSSNLPWSGYTVCLRGWE